MSDSSRNSHAPPVEGGAGTRSSAKRIGEGHDSRRHLDPAAAFQHLQAARRAYVVACAKAAAVELNGIEQADEQGIVDRVLLAVSELRAAETELMAGPIR